MKSPDSAELNQSREPRDHGTAPAHNLPLSQAWITDELIAKHQQLWSKRYKRDIPREEAIEIIMNIKRFAEAVLKMDEGETS